MQTKNKYKRLKKAFIVILLLLIAFWSYVEIVNRNSINMTNKHGTEVVQRRLGVGRQQPHFSIRIDYVGDNPRTATLAHAGSRPAQLAQASSCGNQITLACCMMRSRWASLETGRVGLTIHPYPTPLDGSTPILFWTTVGETHEFRTTFAGQRMFATVLAAVPCS